MNHEKKNWTRWSDEDTAALLRMLAEGKRVRACARHLRRTVRSVYGQCYKAGYRINPVREDPPKLWTKAEEKTLSLLIHKGQSINQCAIRLNRSIDSVRGKWRALNLTWEMP